jgi:hypothetical protein
MLRGRPTPFEGAFVEPKQRRFDFIAKTERSLQPTTSAISAGGQLLKSMSRICACCESARFGAILGSDVHSNNILVEAAILKKAKWHSLRPVRMLAQVRWGRGRVDQKPFSTSKIKIPAYRILHHTLIKRREMMISIL